MKKKASNFKRRPSQKIKILHTEEVAPVFNFYRALHFFVRVLFAMVLIFYFAIASRQNLKGFAGRALGIAVVSFFLGQLLAPRKRFSG